MQSLIIFSLTFLFVFGWKVTPILDLIAILSFALFLIVFGVFRTPIPRQTFSIALLLAGVVLYSCIAVILGGAADPQIGLRSIRSMVNFLGAAALAKLYLDAYGREDLLQAVFVHVYIVLSVHALLIVLMYIFASLRDAVYSLVNSHDYVNLNTPFLLGLRVPGLTYGLSVTSTLQMFGLLLASSIFPLVRGRGLLITLFWVSILLLLLSVLLTGRSGLLLALILLPLQWMIVRLRSVGASRPKKLAKNYAPFLLVLITVAAIGFSLKDSALASRFGYNIRTAREVAEVIRTGGDTYAIVNLGGMYFLPDDPSVLLFGSGGLGRGALGNIESDIGYVLLIYASGIVGLLILMVPLLYALLAVWYSDQSPIKLRVAICMILLATFILNFKTLTLMTRNLWSVQALLIAAIFLQSAGHMRQPKLLMETAPGAGKTNPVS